MENTTEKEKKKVVWIRCRAGSVARGDDVCYGNQAEIVSSINIPNKLAYSGNLSRYRCRTCGRVFVVRT